jgi:hypothetical protein
MVLAFAKDFTLEDGGPAQQNHHQTTGKPREKYHFNDTHDHENDYRKHGLPR